MKKAWILLMALLLVINAFAASAHDQWQKGMEAFNKGEYSKAISYFKMATEADPQEGEYFKWLGIAYLNNKQYQEAIDASKQALSHPHLAESEWQTWSVLIQSQESLGQIDSAISSLNKYIELKPDDSDAFMRLSGLFLENSRFEEALTAAKRAVELKPDSASALHALGLAYGGCKRYDESLDALTKAVELDPTNAVFRYHLGNLFFYRGDYAAAVEALRKAIEIVPNGSSLRSDLAQVYLRMGKYDEAVAAVNRALDLEGLTGAALQEAQKEPAAYCFGLRSLINRYKGIREESFLDAEKAYSLSPGNEYALVSLGVAYLDRGQYDRSLELLTQAKNNNLARILEATAMARQGNIKEAGDIYFSIPENEMTPNNVPLMADRAALLQIFKPLVKDHRDKASSFETKGQYKEALLELSEALKTADDAEAPAIRDSIFGLVRKRPSLSELPEDARKHALKGEMLIKEGGFEQAGTEIQAAIHIAPYAAQLYYNSALIQAQLKRYPEAIRQMKLYLQAVPDAPDARAAKDEITKWEFLLEKEK
jgi:tetratricopeptide (TPR) repeat protein